jgi:hypothetical protein
MKIVIVSDIHANAESLQVLPEDYDELWILGDLVNSEASYAVWEDRSVRLMATSYAVGETVRKIQALPVPAEIKEHLSMVLRCGGFPKLP